MNSLATRIDPDATDVPPVGLLCHFDTAPTRYACYPTEDRFTSVFDADAARLALLEHGGATGVGGGLPLSVDIRLPLGGSRPGHAATRTPPRGSRRFSALEEEIRLAAAAMGARQSVGALRFGGAGVGTPGDAMFERLLESLDGAFAFTSGIELGIEVEPTATSAVRLSRLRALGFKHVTFDLRRPRAQAQRDSMPGLVRAARELGFATLVARVAHGFPTLRRGESSPDVSAMAALRPDRIRLESAGASKARAAAAPAGGLPASLRRAQRAEARATAIETLLSRGYVHVGMDQFALPDDRLAVARRQGRCHVDLDGVCERCDGDLLGLGMSATSRIGRSYYRNFSDERAYADAIGRGRLPVESGVTLNRDDLVRRTLIHALIGNRRVDFESIELGHLVHVPEYFAAELDQFSAMVRSGLARRDADGIELTASGDYVACAVAMAFDRWQQKDLPRGRPAREDALTVATVLPARTARGCRR
jgi:oxygen-independent coproporphyrinogen III oxidase